MIVRELITRFGFDLNQAQLRRYEQGVNNFRRQADEAADSFRNMFAAFLGFGAIRGIARVADDMQSLEARVGQLPQTITSAADAFDMVTARASAARQSIDAYTNFYIKLQHAGKEFIKTQEEGLLITDTISKALILGGATAQEQASTLLQFGQAIGSNVLQGDEFRALSESAPQLVDAISKQLNIARSDLKKYASEGKLTSKVVVEAVKAISSEFDQRFKEMPLTIGAATTVVANRWAVFINRLNRESSAVTKTANFFLKSFDAIESGLADMVKFFGGATNTLKFFGIALATALAPFVFRTAAGAIAFLLSPMGLLLASLLLIGLAIEDFYQWMTGGQSVFQQWFGNFDEAMKKLREYEGVITFVRDAVIVAVGVMALNWTWAAGVAVASAAKAFGAWVAGLARFGIAMAANLLAVGAWVVGILAQTAVLVAGWVASFISMALAAAPVVLPILAIIAAIGLLVAGIYYLYKNWDKVWGGIKDIASNVWDGIAGGFNAMVNKLKGYWNSFKSFFGMKVDTTLGASSGVPVVTPTVAAGAAVAGGGVAGAGSSVVINQTLPPGTTAETAQAAKDATQRAVDSAFDVGRLSRQMGQVGG
jgi:tape measure domain-containing protein